MLLYSKRVMRRSGARGAGGALQSNATTPPVPPTPLPVALTAPVSVDVPDESPDEPALPPTEAPFTVMPVPPPTAGLAGVLPTSFWQPKHISQRQVPIALQRCRRASARTVAFRSVGTLAKESAGMCS